MHYDTARQEARRELLERARRRPLRQRVRDQPPELRQEPSLSEDGRKQLTGGKYQVNFVPGDYFVKGAHVYFGRAERHWAIQCYKVEFLCAECWVAAPEHSPGCPASSAPPKPPR